MTNDNNSTSHEHKKCKGMNGNGILGGIYGMAFLGGVAYYIQHAATFWAGVLGFFKVLIWSAALMYKVLELLRM